jgi:HlyD family secretion protein
MRGRSLAWAGGGAAATLVVLVASLLAGPRSASSSGGSGTEVEVQQAVRRTITPRVKASGEIVPEKKVDISARVVGVIVDLPVKEGDRVAQGQVLLEIERQMYESVRDQQRAALDQAEVTRKRLDVALRTAERNLVRLRELKTKEFASQESLEAAEDAVENAKIERESHEHQIAQTRSAFKAATDDLERTTIRAPMGGVVVALNTEKGETAVPGSNNVPGSTLMTIADMSRLLARVEVSEVDVVGLEAGQVAEVSVDALPNEPQKGAVTEIGSSGHKDPATGAIRFTVKVALKDPHAGLKPSMTAKVSVVTKDRANVVSVPIQAVLKRRLDAEGKEIADATSPAGRAAALRECVFVVTEGKATLTPVTTGAADDLYVELESGVAAGARVVIGPYRTLKALKDAERVQWTEPEGTRTGKKGASDVPPATTTTSGTHG